MILKLVLFNHLAWKKQGKSEGFDSCDQPSNLIQTLFKSLIFQAIWPKNLMDTLTGVSPMFPRPYIPRVLYSPVLYSSVPMFPRPKFPSTYIPRVLCSPNLTSPMFPGSYVPRALCSPGPMFPLGHRYNFFAIEPFEICKTYKNVADYFFKHIFLRFQDLKQLCHILKT